MRGSIRSLYIPPAMMWTSSVDHGLRIVLQNDFAGQSLMQISPHSVGASLNEFHSGSAGV